MGRGAEILRLFVAARVEPAAGTAMLDEARRVVPEPWPRWGGAESLHLTLLFIGDTDARQLEDVKESVRRSVAGIGEFTLTPERLASLPERGDPRLVALVTDAPPGLMEVQRRLVKRLARPGTKDRFTPHITLGRYAHSDRPVRVEAASAVPPFAITAIELVRSVLKPTGAEHTVIERVPLG